ncbi:MAG: hypothetical protein WB777_06375 [Mycobacterium sp.]
MAEPLTCEMCGAGFSARSDAVYCSSACRQKAHRARTLLRTADPALPRGRRRPTPRVLVKPDVAGTIARARVQQRRAHELCRTAEEILRASAESHEHLKSVVWLRRARIPAVEQPTANHDDMDTTSRRLG